ncbi:MraY family glycosyltransferase [Micromonospora sp. DT81.3]|uniref:MraY family glycosyltransferase n=1 Tax=Actinomycetes TaxID=1760 RepID=UPI003CF67DBB
MKQYVFTILFTAAMTLSLAWAVWQLSLRYKLYPGIRERDVHKNPTPRLGGVAIYLAIVAAIAVSAANPFFEIFWVNPRPVVAILIASTIIVLIGVADDLWDLDWMIKLGAQFLAAGVIAWFGELQIYSLPIGGLAVGSSVVSVTLTVFAIVIVMNAVNFIDGLDGLVAGVCLISNGIFFAYSYMLVRDIGSSTYFNLASFLAAVLVGACAGFLPLNWNPAKIFMGDSGALVLGLLMATSAIAITGQLDPAVLDPDEIGRSQLLGAFIPILLPVVVVMLPLLDFGLAVIRRMQAGKSPFSPDRKHLHHRMLDMGHTDRDAVLIFYAWTAVIGIAVLLMYIAVREDWPGTYWIGVAFGVVGAAACLVVTLMPSRRASAAARPLATAPKPPRADAPNPPSANAQNLEEAR